MNWQRNPTIVLGKAYVKKGGEYIFINKQITESDGPDSLDTRLKTVWLVLIPPTLVGDVLNILSRLVRMAQKLGGAISALDGLLNLDKQTGRVVNVTSPHSIYKLKNKTKL